VVDHRLLGETTLQIARDEFAEPAQRKGVQLEIADTSAWVRSDPVLLRLQEEAGSKLTLLLQGILGLWQVARSDNGA